jgi:hypothetical protein
LQLKWNLPLGLGPAAGWFAYCFSTTTMVIRRSSKMTQPTVTGRMGDRILQRDPFGKAPAKRAKLSGLSTARPKKRHHMTGAAFGADALHGAVHVDIFQEFILAGKVFNTALQAKLIVFHNNPHFFIRT